MPRKSAAPKRKRKRPAPLFKRKREPDTPAKQHKRFLEMAEEIGASKNPKDFERAFKRITGAAPRGASKGDS